MVELALRVPYSKWKRHFARGGSSSAEVREELPDEAACIHAPREDRTHELGRLVHLQAPLVNAVRVFRAMMHKLASPDPLADLYDPSSKVWLAHLEDGTHGPYAGANLAHACAAASQQHLPLASLPGGLVLAQDAQVVHSKVRVVLPLWLLAAHLRLGGTDRASLPGEQDSSSNGAVPVLGGHQAAPAAVATQANQSQLAVAAQHVPQQQQQEPHSGGQWQGLESDIWSSLHRLRDAPDYEQIVATNMEIDEDEGAAWTHVPDLVALLPHGYSPEAPQHDMPPAPLPLHVCCVLDTSFLCHPVAQQALRTLQAHFAPRAQASASTDPGAPPLMVSMVVPKLVYRELDHLKDAKDRPEVARCARAAFGVLLEGFRSRDGFMALQTHAEYKEAMALTEGEDYAPTADQSVVQCARHTLRTLQGGPPPQEQREGAARVVVLSNDSGVCVMAESHQIVSARHVDMPPPDQPPHALADFLQALAMRSCDVPDTFPACAPPPRARPAPPPAKHAAAAAAQPRAPGGAPPAPPPPAPHAHQPMHCSDSGGPPSPRDDDMADSTTLPHSPHAAIFYPPDAPPPPPDAAHAKLLLAARLHTPHASSPGALPLAPGSPAKAQVHVPQPPPPGVHSAGAEVWGGRAADGTAHATAAMVQSISLGAAAAVADRSGGRGALQLATAGASASTAAQFGGGSGGGGGCRAGSDPSPSLAPLHGGAACTQSQPLGPVLSYDDVEDDYGYRSAGGYAGGYNRGGGASGDRWGFYGSGGGGGGVGGRPQHDRAGGGPPHHMSAVGWHGSAAPALMQRVASQPPQQQLNHLLSARHAAHDVAGSGGAGFSGGGGASPAMHHLQQQGAPNRPAAPAQGTTAVPPVHSAPLGAARTASLPQQHDSAGTAAAVAMAATAATQQQALLQQLAQSSSTPQQLQLQLQQQMLGIMQAQAARLAPAAGAQQTAPPPAQPTLPGCIAEAAAAAASAGVLHLHAGAAPSPSPQPAASSILQQHQLHRLGSDAPQLIQQALPTQGGLLLGNGPQGVLPGSGPVPGLAQAVMLQAAGGVPGTAGGLLVATQSATEGQAKAPPMSALAAAVAAATAGPNASGAAARAGVDPEHADQLSAAMKTLRVVSAMKQQNQGSGCGGGPGQSAWQTDDTLQLLSLLRAAQVQAQAQLQQQQQLKVQADSVALPQVQASQQHTDAMALLLQAQRVGGGLSQPQHAPGASAMPVMPVVSLNNQHQAQLLLVQQQQQLLAQQQQQQQGAAAAALAGLPPDGLSMLMSAQQHKLFLQQQQQASALSGTIGPISGASAGVSSAGSSGPMTLAMWLGPGCNGEAAAPRHHELSAVQLQALLARATGTALAAPGSLAAGVGAGLGLLAGHAVAGQAQLAPGLGYQEEDCEYAHGPARPRGGGGGQ